VLRLALLSTEQLAAECGRGKRAEPNQLFRELYRVLLSKSDGKRHEHGGSDEKESRPSDGVLLERATAFRLIKSPVRRTDQLDQLSSATKWVRSMQHPMRVSEC
jgi:hypothetical protein